MEDKRPLVIYPENASRVIREVCPKADFTVILLGKNIYRAIYFDPAKDIYPSVNRLYIDIFDIQYHQAEEEIDQISQFICSRLRHRLTALMDRMDPAPRSIARYFIVRGFASVIESKIMLPHAGN